MDARIVVALISGVVTLLAVVLNWVFQNLSYSSLPKSKRRIITGSWRGTTHQDLGPENTPIDVDLVMDLETSWRRIHGKCRVKGGGDELTVKIKGGYRELDHVFLEYNSYNNNKINFGYIILKLNGNGNALTGKIIGYGNKSNKLIKGDMALNKVDA